MTALKDSIENLQTSLESALLEVKNIKKSIDKLESAFIGEVSKDISKPPGKRGQIKRAPAKRGSATKKVIDLILKSENGISVEEIKSKTGLAPKSVYAILNKAKKDKKIKSPKRGFYVKV